MLLFFVLAVLTWQAVALYLPVDTALVHVSFTRPENVTATNFGVFGIPSTCYHCLPSLVYDFSSKENHLFQIASWHSSWLVSVMFNNKSYWPDLSYSFGEHGTYQLNIPTTPEGTPDSTARLTLGMVTPPENSFIPLWSLHFG